MRKFKNGLKFVLEDITVFLHDNGDVTVDPPLGTSPSDVKVSLECLSFAELLHGIRMKGFDSALVISGLSISKNQADFRSFVEAKLPLLKTFSSIHKMFNNPTNGANHE